MDLYTVLYKKIHTSMLFSCMNCVDLLLWVYILGFIAQIHILNIEHMDYSTVTDFAKLRGWSTSVPRNTAT